MENICEIVPYEADSVKLEVRLESETTWLTRCQMAQLFKTTERNIGTHISNIFKEKELEENNVTKLIEKFSFPIKRGTVPKLYNLDAIIAVGYRVNSPTATKFRIWAAKILKDYLLKGYAINPHFNKNHTTNGELIDTINKLVIEMHRELKAEIIKLREEMYSMLVTIRKRGWKKEKRAQINYLETDLDYLPKNSAESFIASGLEWESDKNNWEYKTLGEALMLCGIPEPKKSDCKKAESQIEKILKGNVRKYKIAGSVKYFLPPKKT
jgi:hypothetical protein